MTEFQELIQDAPNFVSMERGELVAYAYGMFAAGTKANAENAKLLELVRDVWHLFTEHGAVHPCDLPVVDAVRDRMRELGAGEDE